MMYSLLSEDGLIKKSLIYSYEKAKYFYETMELINGILSYENLNVGKFNFNSIQCICKYMGIDRRIIESDKIKRDYSIKNSQDAIIDMCNSLKADKYINSIGGTKLYSDDYFRQKNIDLFFIKNESEEYKQFGDRFIPNLSIIDVLMHNDKKDIRKMLNQYSLIKSI